MMASRGEASAAEFDVLVLGGGAAGCVIAGRLSEDPTCRVGLVEAGPDYGAYERNGWPRSLLDARVDGALTALAGGVSEAHDWGFEGGLSSSRARVIGGCSAHNGCEVLWGSVADYDEWAASTGDPGWSHASLLPYLQRAHETIRARPSDVRHLTPIRRALLAAGRQLGLPELADVNDVGALEGAGPIPVNAVGVIRWNAAFAYLDPGRDRPNLTVIDRTLVDRLVVAGGRAGGVEVIREGRRSVLRAETYVLAAGSYATPAILGRSGVGAGDDLRRMGITPAVDLPGVGAGLLDHPYVLASWSTHRRLVNADARLDGVDLPLSLAEVKVRTSRAPENGWDVTIGAWSGQLFDQRAHAPGAHVAGMAPCAMRAVSRGRVRLRSADPNALPAIEHGFLTDPGGADLGVLMEGVDAARRLAATRAWRHWCGEEVSPGAHVTGAELAAWIRANVAGTYHPSGTCRMGRPGDRETVCDPAGRVAGVDNVRVADASLFPSIPAANIHLSVLAVAERIADVMRGHGRPQDAASHEPRKGNT